MNTNVEIALRITSLTPERADACEAIARSMPKWFGIEDGLVELRSAVERRPGYVALDGETVAGFVTIDTPFLETWEITWMAVGPDWHRRGVGRALVEAVAAAAHASGATLLHVKTLADLHPSPEYAQTRAFYEAVGFVRLIVIPDLWGPANPCLLMVKPL